MAKRSQLGFRYASAKLRSKHEFTQKFRLDPLNRMNFDYCNLRLIWKLGFGSWDLSSSITAVVWVPAKDVW